jgi:hypothetical protein
MDMGLNHHKTEGSNRTEPTGGQFMTPLSGTRKVNKGNGVYSLGLGSNYPYTRLDIMSCSWRPPDNGPISAG